MVIEEIENAGGVVWYDYQFDAAGNEIPGAEPPGDAWLRWLLGDDFFANVTKLDLTQTDISDTALKQLEPLADLRSLSLGESIGDARLAALQGLTHLRTLHLRANKVSEEGIKNLQKNLPNCKISRY